MYFDEMAYIKVDEELRGIDALFAYSPNTAKPLQLLVQAVLRDEVGLNKGERELIATYVSHLNNSQYCSLSPWGRSTKCVLW